MILLLEGVRGQVLQTVSAVSMVSSCMHLSSAWETNSGPLSKRRYRGAPWVPMTGEHLDGPTRADRGDHADRRALAGVLVDDGQALDLLAIGAGVEHEVVGPHEVGAGGRQPTGPRGGEAPPWTPPRQLQSDLPPQPVRPVPAQAMALALQEDADASVAGVPKFRFKLGGGRRAALTELTPTPTTGLPSGAHRPARRRKLEAAPVRSPFGRPAGKPLFRFEAPSRAGVCRAGRFGRGSAHRTVAARRRKIPLRFFGFVAPRPALRCFATPQYRRSGAN